MSHKKPRGKHAAVKPVQSEPVSIDDEFEEQVPLEVQEGESAGQSIAEDAADAVEADVPAAPALPSLPEIVSPATAAVDLDVPSIDIPAPDGQEELPEDEYVEGPPLFEVDPNAVPTAIPAEYDFDAVRGTQSLTIGQPPIMPEGVTLRKKRSVGKVVGITFGVIIGVVLIAYIAGAVVFMGRMFPNTVMAGRDISMMTNEELAALLDETVDDYKLDIVGNGFSYSTTGSDIDLSIDSQGVVDSVHEDHSAWTWPLVLIANEEKDETDLMAVSYKKQNYDYKLVSAVSNFNKDATPPVDATIAYNEEKGKFLVVDEIIGTQYDSHTILAAMQDSIEMLEPSIKLTDDFLIQPDVFSTDERLINSAELATGLVSAHVTLKMGDQVVAEIGGNNLSSFIRLDDSLGVTLDEPALDQWVTDLSSGFDTVGTTRSYTRADGKEITVSGGAYGWSTDAPQLKDQVVAAIKSGETTTIDIPCEQTAAVYNGPGQRDWGNRYIDVDLSEQYVRFYGDDGSIIWESDCISGSPDGEHNTWPGVWYITNKESPSKLIGYLPSGEKEYETTVSYWMAFEGNGIGLHDATWQPSFGGSMYAYGYGSHGCVNLPYYAAAELYDICYVGDVVIAHY